MTPTPPLCDLAALQRIEREAPQWLTPADRHALRLHESKRRRASLLSALFALFASFSPLRGAKE